MVNVATPDASSDPVPSVVVPLRKLTDPSGVAPAAATLAVSVTTNPKETCQFTRVVVVANAAAAGATEGDEDWRITIAATTSVTGDVEFAIHSGDWLEIAPA